MMPCKNIFDAGSIALKTGRRTRYLLQWKWNHKPSVATGDAKD